MIYHNPYLCHVHHPFLKNPILWYIAIHFKSILYYLLEVAYVFQHLVSGFLSVSFIGDFKNLGHTKLSTARKNGTQRAALVTAHDMVGPSLRSNNGWTHKYSAMVAFQCLQGYEHLQPARPRSTVPSLLTIICIV